MYRVTCLYGGTTYTLHDPDSDLLRVYDDELETEDNSPGTFKFTISKDHPYVDKIVGLSSDIRVYDGDEEIFRGRPVDDGEDLYRTRSFECEGELAFLYDSIQPRREMHNITPLEFFSLLINEHNAQVQNKGPIDKTFTVGVVSVTDPNDSLYRYTNRETTLDDILDKLVNRLGGHLQTRIQNGVRYIDLLKDVTTVSDQPIQLGDNLLTYAKDTDYTDIATACIPLGCSLEQTEIAALDAYLTVADVNQGSDTIQITSAVQRYGFICKTVSFDDITVPANLLRAGQRWLEDEQYENMTLQLTAVDLHALGYDVQPIRTNRKVRVVSDPHGMDRYFEVSKRTYHLTQPEADTVTFGASMRQKTYTSSSSSSVSAVTAHAEQVRSNMDGLISDAKRTASDTINQLSHGYVVLDPVTGPERILIMDTNSVDTAQSIWKWDMNGFAYSSSGINGPWETAITMAGEIVADFIATGTLLASLIKAGKISSQNGRVYFDLDNNKLVCSQMTNGTVYPAGNLTVEIESFSSAGQYSSDLNIYNDTYPEYGLHIFPPGSDSSSIKRCILWAKSELLLRYKSDTVKSYYEFTMGEFSNGNDPFVALVHSVQSRNAFLVGYDSSASGNHRHYASFTGDLGVGQDLDVYGDITHRGSSILNSSDRRLKEDIEILEDPCIEAVGKTDIVQFRFKGKEGISVGVIAQDLIENLEEEGVEWEDLNIVQTMKPQRGAEDKTEYYGVEYDHFLLARIAYDEKIIKKQQAEIEYLQDRMDRLERLITEGRVSL